MKGEEHTRLIISSFLTRVLVLFGRLTSEYNPRYLPQTVSSLLTLISEMKEFGKNIPEFDYHLRDIINDRVRFSLVFAIPKSLEQEPDLDGIHKSIADLVAPLIKDYCGEEKRFLMCEEADELTKIFILSRARKNCALLEDYSLVPENSEYLRDFAGWCEMQLRKNQAAM